MTPCSGSHQPEPSNGGPRRRPIPWREVKRSLNTSLYVNALVIYSDGVTAVVSLMAGIGSGNVSRDNRKGQEEPTCWFEKLSG